MDTVIVVLKWIALVFAAGVVAQFGKSLTLKILESRRRRKAERLMESTPGPGPTLPDSKTGDEADLEILAKQQQIEAERIRQKAEKKSRKAELKRAKKLAKEQVREADE
ncbi:MAG: hypothetical protein GF355_02615 [Candidatus Eisenbacteria bacterium]|nr:hypothetical protein [Candidatus Eisenbacteria bacterium]